MFTNGIMDIAKFKKMEKIGESDFGEIYSALKQDNDEVFSCNISRQVIVQKTQDEMRNIMNDVKTISKLYHPNILRFIGFSPLDFDSQLKPIIISELLANCTLTQILELERKSQEIKEWDDTKKLIAIFGIASGMQYLHSHNILHNNLKPDNIFLDKYLCVKISEYGLPQIYHYNPSSADSTILIKTAPIYTAPEIWRNQANTKASNVYSFAIIAYEIMTGQIPFEKLTLDQIRQKVLIEKSRPEFKFPVPSSYQKLIEDCWNQDPSKRPTFDQIVEKLKIDPGFITEMISNDDYLDYVRFVDKSVSTYKASSEIIKMKNSINTKSKVFKKVAISKINKNLEKIQKDDKSQRLYPKDEYKELKLSCQKLVKEADNNSKKKFIVGKNLLEGGDGFPQNTPLGIKYLKISLEEGFIDSAIYYSRILLEGKILPKNPSKVIESLEPYLSMKNPIIYTLYGKAKKEERKYSEAKVYFLKAAEDGNGEGMYEYGLMLHNGEGVSIDKEEATRYFEMAKFNGFSINYKNEESAKQIEKKRRRSSCKYKVIEISLFTQLDDSCQKQIVDAEKGDSEALIFVSSSFIEGSNNFPKNLELGISYLEFGVTKKNPEVMKYYASLLLKGQSVPKDEDRALNLMNDAATKLKSAEDKLKIIELILLHESFDINDPNANENVNYFLAKKCAKEAAHYGNPKAMTVYGEMCLKEKKNKYGEIKADFKKALKYFKLAVDHNDPDGLSFYSYYLDKGIFDLLPNKKEAVEYYRRSAENGSLMGCALYGLSLIDPSYEINNKTEGLKLIKNAVDNKNKFGYLAYAVVLSNGFNAVTIDNRSCAQYLQKSADYGVASALANMGISYQGGSLFPKDIDKSIKYFKLAIEEGSIIALYHFSQMHGKETFQGFPLKKDDGLKLLKQAADLGNINAINDYCEYLLQNKDDFDKNKKEIKKYLEIGINLEIDNCIQLHSFYFRSKNENIIEAPKNLNERLVIDLPNGQKKIHLGVRKVYHATSSKNAFSITDDEELRKGSFGMFGPGIYFAATKEIAEYKCTAAGHVAEGFIVCHVDFGDALILEKPNRNLTEDDIKGFGCNSVMGRSGPNKDWEFIVYDSKRTKQMYILTPKGSKLIKSDSNLKD